MMNLKESPRPLLHNAIWDGDPAAYESRRNLHSWLEKRRLSFWAAWLASKQEQENPPHVLEIGSGTGALARNLLINRTDLFSTWTGLDPLENYVAYAQDKVEKLGLSHQISFKKGRAESPKESGIASCFYDRIISNDVLHHVEDMAQVIEQMADISQKGTYWGLMEPNFWHPYVFLCQCLREGEKNFFPKYFLQQAHRFGWECESHQYLFAIPAFVPAPPKALQILEKHIENKALLGGAVFLSLRRK